MSFLRSRFNKLGRSISLGWFLAYRQVRRSGKATTLLIVFVMTLTFLNLVVVRGVLVGLLQGATDVYREHYARDIILTKLPKKAFIERSNSILATIDSIPQVANYTYRYSEGGEIEANYKDRVRLTDDPNSAGGTITGIDPEREDSVTG